MTFKKIVLFFCIFPLLGFASYPFSNAPIDVIIPATKKDTLSLNACIDGIRKNCRQIRRIIVVSPVMYTNRAEWHPEENYPFSKFDVALCLNHGDTAKAQKYLEEPHSRLGWYYQQLLKLYAPFAIPGISSNVLIVDADTIFLRPVEFIDQDGNGLYNTGTEHHEFYFEHLTRLLPDYKKLYAEYSGISHHMLFQKAVLEDLFNVVEETHQVPFWKGFCLMVDPQYLRAAGASEYEIYFNFVFARSDRVKIRHLNWTNAPSLDVLGKDGLNNYFQQGYDYVSCHKYD